jgi:hypothetical protein
MTGLARLFCVAADQLEELAVIEGSTLPARRRRLMALFAGGRKACSDMIRRPCLGVLRLVAAYAGSRRSPVLSRGVARLAGLLRMNAHERKELSVIERRAAPVRRRGLMALVAASRKSGCDVVRLLCPRVVGLVTAHTRLRRASVLAVSVARLASLLRVCANQLKELAVVERGAAPGGIGRTMTLLAVDRKPGGCMVGICSLVVVRLMAADTVAWGALVDVAPMTAAARCRRVRPDELERCIVIECRLLE